MGERTCSVEDCDSAANVPGSARGFCGKHYQRWKKYGDPLGAHEPVVGVAPCAVNDCGELVTARGWCVKHYTRWIRFGDPTARLLGEVVEGCRICPKCGEDKPLADWSGGWCKRCTALNARRRREDPQVQAAERDYYLRYTEANPGVMAERARSWRGRNPDQVRMSGAMRRARMATARVEAFTPREIFERDGWVCGICKDPIDSTLAHPNMMSASLDHVIPLSRGGFHERLNCQAAHLRCNVRKGARVA